MLRQTCAMGVFGRRRSAAGDRSANRADLAALAEWAASHTGVEAFLEPHTLASSTTLLLVAGDGEFTRRRIASASAAAAFARRVGIPIYDVNRVGTPQRMRDYSARMAARTKAAQSKQAAASRVPSKDAAAIAALAAAAAVPVPTTASDEALRDLWRAARARVHPDRNAGDRQKWDAVEDAARRLGLH